VSNEELIIKTLTGLLTGQQEMTTLYRGQTERTDGLARVLEGLREEQKAMISASEKQEERLQGLLEVMLQYAQGQIEIRQTLSEHAQRLAALERKAS
jgi:hypothetical protein